ncbi:HlyD family efflux transporter periplasmic adaptor subunit [Cobetia sp. 4B]|uniref:HlyD family efflux transporter periplasmic adaptor subunit n=1 Tax=Cobetia sp. 4B TaxID=2758724 RepID=UPI001C05C42B|nr:HlyD family efflux transporter periplasmic adaptor subunit [Cobetia sp. 4B]QWN35866.1 HlyD family efflux transporter periplasmic adaptor subunit [Cobetia sp. 4B]
MWTLFDPLRGLYFHLHLSGLRLIRLWRHCSTQGDLVSRARAEGADVELDDIEGLVRFLQANHLVVATSQQDQQRLSDADSSRKTSGVNWLLHHYLFFRIPLVRPDRHLDSLLPTARRLVSLPAQILLLFLALLGGYFVVRQWPDFVGTLLRFLSWEGVFWYALALMVVKSAHELGHALVAKHYGCRVPTMGVAFLVMFPMLYTDATDTWRLENDRDRLRVAMAGVMTELSIAVLATVCWGLLPEGPLRQAAFFLATTSWMTSLLVNLSPFMRFDGYHALSDLWGIRNLQPRAFAVTRWWLREMLFGFREAPPEAFTRHRRQWLVLYSIGTWIYRFFLFLGIALLVYHFAFKVLGILLFVVEIYWFILRPIMSEVSEVSRRRIPWNIRTALTCSAGCLILGLLFIPWRGHVTLPGVLEADAHLALYPPEPARLKQQRVVQDAHVEAGQVLYEFEQPEIAIGLIQAERQLQALEARLARRAGSAEDLAQQGVLRNRQAELQAEISGLESRASSLLVRAPIAGRVDMPEALHVGQWLDSRQKLADLVSQRSVRVNAFVQEQDLERVKVGSHARFIPDDGNHSSVLLTVRDIDNIGAERLAYPGLASRYGGPLPVENRRRDESDGLRLEDGIYRVTLVPDKAASLDAWQVYGEVSIEGPAESLAGVIFRHAASVMIRESGF